MRPHEAPDKLYLIRNFATPTSLNTTNDCHDKYLPEWYDGKEKDADVEYIRTDVFIEKANEWIDYNNRNGGCNFDGWEQDFKNYIKGEGDYDTRRD